MEHGMSDALALNASFPRRLMLGLCATLLVGAVAPQALSGGQAWAEVSAVNDKAAIDDALTASAQAWSRDDLDAFMHCYEDGPETAYVKAGGVVKGYRAIRDMYAARFGGASGALGQLSMETLDFKSLGPDYALVVGRYHLKPAKPGPEASGIFTLVFHKSTAGWRIISDHTS